VPWLTVAAMLFHRPAAKAARAFVFGATVAVGAGLAACGSDGGTSSFLPPGDPTTAAPGDIVLYAAMAQGDRIDAFRLGEDGLLPAEPFDTITLDNPRRLAVMDGVLYATIFDRVVAMRLGPNGSLPDVPTSQSDSNRRYDPIAIEARNGFVYVAAAGLGQLQSYEVDENGDIPNIPTGAGSTEVPSDYGTLAFDDVSGRFLYAASRDSQAIDLFILEQDGNVPPLGELMEPQDSVSLADDMIIRNGILYVTSGSDRSIRTYTLRANGEVPDDNDSRTESEEFYSDIFIQGDILYAAAYNAGRVDLYTIEPDGMLRKDGPFDETNDDPASYPSKLLINDGILYVAQAGLDRVDAFALDNDGRPSNFPTSSTAPGPDRSYPLDIALYSLD
jgi:6-phosphogluconolactonase (cycloisomerase 2 family)